MSKKEKTDAEREAQAEKMLALFNLCEQGGRIMLANRRGNAVEALTADDAEALAAALLDGVAFLRKSEGKRTP